MCENGSGASLGNIAGILVDHFLLGVGNLLTSRYRLLLHLFVIFFSRPHLLQASLLASQLLLSLLFHLHIVSLKLSAPLEIITVCSNSSLKGQLLGMPGSRCL